MFNRKPRPSRQRQTGRRPRQTFILDPILTPVAILDNPLGDGTPDLDFDTGTFTVGDHGEVNALNDLGRPQIIRLAVLVDRGHRQLPIRADIVGKNIPTQFSDKVKCHMTEIDDRDMVFIKEKQS